MRFVKRYPQRRPMMRGMGADYTDPNYDPEAEGIRSLVASGDMTAAQAAQAGVTVNPAAATNSWDSAAKAISSMIGSATQGYTLYKTAVAGKPVTPTPAPALAQSQLSKWLLYGGIGVAALAIIMAMRKR
jgi:hypothetical protein